MFVLAVRAGFGYKRKCERGRSGETGRRQRKSYSNALTLLANSFAANYPNYMTSTSGFWD